MSTILSHLPGACAAHPLGDPSKMGPGKDRDNALAYEGKDGKVTKDEKQPVAISLPAMMNNLNIHTGSSVPPPMPKDCKTAEDVADQLRYRANHYDVKM